MTPEEAVKALYRIAESGDPEEMHAEADEVLLQAADPEVRAAYNNVVWSARWWAYA